MLHEIQINGFKWLEDTTYRLWQDTIITGKNWEWKSRIIQAIIYTITWEVDWYKKKLQDCSTTLIWTSLSMGRVNGKVRGGVTIHNPTKALCIMVPWYINSLTVKEKLKILIEWVPFSTPSWMWTYESYKKWKKELKSHTKYADEYAEEIIDNLEKVRELWGLKVLEDTDNFVELKERYDKIIKYNETVNSNNELTAKIEELSPQVEWFDPNANLDWARRLLQDKVIWYENLKVSLAEKKTDLTTAQAGKCIACEQDLIDNILIDKLKGEIWVLSKQIKEYGITDLKKDLKAVEDNIKDFNDKFGIHRKIQILESQRIEISEHIESTQEETEDLKIKLENFEWLFSKREQIKLLLDRNTKLEGKIKSLDIESLQSKVDYFEREEKEYFRRRQEDMNSLFDFDFKLYKENTTTGWGQLVYEVSKDWIDYFWLSSWQKLLIDIQISNYLWRESDWIDFMLIDNGERLSNNNYKKALELLWDKQIIITKVTNGDLNLEID